MNFADTNWLEAMFFELKDHPQRRAIVDRFLRRNPGQLGLSPLVYLEARNVFSRVSGEEQPPEWEEVEAGKNGRFYLDPMQWDLVRRDSFDLFRRYGRKMPLGTLDLAILASVRLAGCQQLLSFDETLKAVAVAEEVAVFPPLAEEGKSILARLRA
ncbi:MAG: type II toxin-antitoxin system VapC family toxin [Verrucomicrobia bacterium]|nr:type II toxin-antitoxin system VapC family toxin [Verrucomicrobiota bacterium]